MESFHLLFSVCLMLYYFQHPQAFQHPQVIEKSGDSEHILITKLNKLSRTSSPTFHLTRRYIIALCTIALLALIGQAVIQSALQQQSSDALVINIAGRQRMLSQRLSKAALTLDIFTDTTSRKQNVQELISVIALWQHAQEGLEYGDAGSGLPGHNSMTIKQLFALIEPDYQAMLQSSKGLIALIMQTPSAPSTEILPFIQTILPAQAIFLPGMDRIVQQYQQEAQDHVTHVKLIEITLFSFTLIVLILEGFFVFRPAAQRIHQTLTDLLQANERVAREEVTRKKAERILALNEALASSQPTMPHARIAALGHYQVRDKEGIYYDVFHQIDDGQQVFFCSCRQYQEQMICPHALAAAALHSVSGFQQY